MTTNQPPESWVLYDDQGLAIKPVDALRMVQNLRRKIDEPCPAQWRWWYYGALDVYLITLGVIPFNAVTPTEKVEDTFLGFKYMRDETYGERLIRLADAYIAAVLATQRKDD